MFAPFLNLSTDLTSVQDFNLVFFPFFLAVHTGEPPWPPPCSTAFVQLGGSNWVTFGVGIFKMQISPG